MKNSKIIFVTIVVFLSFFSCNSKKDKEENLSEYMAWFSWDETQTFSFVSNKRDTIFMKTGIVQYFEEDYSGGSSAGSPGNILEITNNFQISGTISDNTNLITYRKTDRSGESLELHFLYTDFHIFRGVIKNEAIKYKFKNRVLEDLYIPKTYDSNPFITALICSKSEGILFFKTKDGMLWKRI